MNDETNTINPAEPQPKTFRERLEVERAKEKRLYAEYKTATAAAKPYTDVAERIGNKWCESRRRIELFEVMLQEGNQ